MSMFADLPTEVGVIYEGERIRKSQMQVEFGGPFAKYKFELARVKPADEIEDGKITRPVKGATLIGNGPDVLTKVSMVGNDLELDAGVGTCGKEGQSVPVGVGQPTIKIDGLTVGGTSV